MAQSLGEISVKLGLSAQEFTRQFSSFSRKVESNVEKLNSRFESITNVGQRLSASISLPLTAAGVAALKLASDVEQAEIAFTSLTGSAEAAQKVLADLTELASNTTFSLSGLRDSSKLLFSFGFEANRVVPILRTLSDAVAATGGGAADIDSVARALGQIQAKGKLSTEEVLQLTERGIPAFDILREKIGLTSEQLGDLGNQGITSDTAISALLEGLNDRFEGLAEKQSKTLAGVVSNFTDALKQQLAVIGQEIEKTFNVTGVLSRLTEQLKLITEGFKNLKPEIKEFALIATAIVAAIGPLLVALGGIGFAITGIAKGFTAILPAIKLVKTLFVGLSSATAILAAKVVAVVTVVAALALAVKSAYDAFEGFRNIVDSVADSVGDFFSFISSAIKTAIKKDVEAIISFFEPLTNLVSNVFSSITDQVNSNDSFQKFKDAVLSNIASVKSGLATTFDPFIEKKNIAFTPIDQAALVAQFNPLKEEADELTRSFEELQRAAKIKVTVDDTEVVRLPGLIESAAKEIEELRKKKNEAFTVEEIRFYNRELEKAIIKAKVLNKQTADINPIEPNGFNLPDLPDLQLGDTIAPDLSSIQESTETLIQPLGIVSNLFDNLGSTISANLATGRSAFEGFGRSVGRILVDIGKQLLKTLILQSLIGVFTGGASTGLGAATSGLSALSNLTPTFGNNARSGIQIFGKISNNDILLSNQRASFKDDRLFG